MAQNGTHVKEEALVDSPTYVLEEEISGDQSGSRKGKQPAEQSKQKKRKRATGKCGACTGVSRPCGPACSYRKLFPDSCCKMDADLITKFFQKDQLLELANRCRNVPEFNKLRDTLFQICIFLHKDPLNTPLDENAALKSTLKSIAEEYRVTLKKFVDKQVGD